MYESKYVWILVNFVLKRIGLQIYGGPRSLSHDFKYGPSLSKAVGPVDPFFMVVKKSHFNKNIHLIVSLRTPQNRKYMWVINTVKAVLSSHSKKTITNGGLMKVAGIAVCSPWSILQYF